MGRSLWKKLELEEEKDRGEEENEKDDST